MSLWTRIANALKGDNRLNRELDAEMESHIEDAVAAGRDPSEARRAFGRQLQMREASRDIRIVQWLDALRADAIFGWRQLMKNRVTASAAILSLALGTGACTSAFRLIDAILLRPLPVANPDRLYTVTRFGAGSDGQPEMSDGWSYPSFERMRDAVSNDADLIAVSYVERVDVANASGQDVEKAQLQYVSGSMFPSFGLRPALGRLITQNDNRKPGAEPYVVLSFDYWTRRFAQDHGIIGRSLHIGARVYEIIGVAPENFTGTETGSFTDLFVPAVMHPGATKSDWTWHRTLAHLKAGRSLESSFEQIRAVLNATSRAFEEERAKGFTGMTRVMIDRFLDQKVELVPASAGASELQHEYRRALAALAVLVVLVLLIACANVANLMTAQAASRAREMALRVSIGAGRLRLIQLVLVESGWISLLAAIAGGLFAWWSAPFVVSLINPSDNPARLYLPWDWRVLAFDIALTLTVTILFGLTPALRASSVQPASALKGGDDAHSRRRLMHALIAAQVAFCFVVLFVSGLFAASFERLSNKPTGFSTDRLLTLEMLAQTPQPTIAWEHLAAQLRAVPGVETVAYASGALLAGNDWTKFISVNGAPPSPVLAHMLNVSPGWIDAMKLHLVDGRDFRTNESSRQITIVNQAFVKQFFNGVNPLRRTFETGEDDRGSTEIVGIVNDAAYRNLRDPILPIAYTPYLSPDPATRRKFATLIIRTASANPLALAPALRQAITRARSDFRIDTIRTQEEINRSQTVRERLLAMLALFFAAVAMLLAGIGLYGVLDYSVLQRRREFGIRIAVGAPASNIARLVGFEVFGVVCLGAVAGLVLGMASARYIDSLFYSVRSTDADILAIPSITILAVALLAAVRPVIHAVRIDPVRMLRSE